MDSTAGIRVQCLICERLDPPCGWVQPFLSDELLGTQWSVCQDCVDRRMVGGD